MRSLLSAITVVGGGKPEVGDEAKICHNNKANSITKSGGDNAAPIFLKSGMNIILGLACLVGSTTTFDRGRTGRGNASTSSVSSFNAASVINSSNHRFDGKAVEIGLWVCRIERLAVKEGFNTARV